MHNHVLVDTGLTPAVPPGNPPCSDQSEDSDYDSIWTATSYRTGSFSRKIDRAAAESCRMQARGNLSSAQCVAVIVCNPQPLHPVVVALSQRESAPHYTDGSPAAALLQQAPTGGMCTCCFQRRRRSSWRRSGAMGRLWWRRGRLTHSFHSLEPKLTIKAPLTSMRSAAPCRSLVDTVYSLKDEVQELKQVSGLLTY